MFPAKLRLCVCTDHLPPLTTDVALVSAAQWSAPSNAKSRRNETEAPSEHQVCRRPDSITIIDDNGQEIKITVPEGKNTDYENAFVKGDYTSLMQLAKVNRNLRFTR
jgi:hypothetical protein